jgi:methionyl-tRNA formyltransferase
VRVVFMGTGDFAVPALFALAESGYDVAAAVSQPDRPKGRGLLIEPTPVSQAATELGIPLWQPETLRNDEAEAKMLGFKPDIVVVAAYGKILPDWVFTKPPLGAINIHGSLLPAYRGAAPIQRAVMNGDPITGVTILKVAREVDTGDILLRETIDIEADETSGELFQRLAILGAAALVRALDIIENGNPEWKPQTNEATYADKIDKSEARVAWDDEAEVIKNKARGLNPNPGAYFMLNGKRVKLWRAAAMPDNNGKQPGEIIDLLPAGPVAATGAGAVLLSEVQPEGKAVMGGAEFARGYRINPGSMLE